MIKKKEYLFFIVFSFLIAGIAVAPFFFFGIYRGADLQFHLSRFDGIITALLDHQFPLALYPNKNFGFGYPSPLFYSDLFLIVPALVRYVLDIPLITFYKVFVWVCVLLTAYSIMYCTYRISSNKQTSVLISFLFVMTNYYQTDLFVRCALGEILVFIFLPWLILNVYLFIYEKKNNYLSLGILFACVVYCHVITFVLSVSFFGIILMMNVKILSDKKRLFCLFKAASIGFCLAFSFIVPMIEQYTSQTLMVHKIQNTLLETTAVNPLELFTDFFIQFKGQYLHEEGISNIDLTKSLGLLLTLFPLWSLFVKNKCKAHKDMFLVFVIFVAMSTTLVPLYKIELLSFVQFPSRMYIIASMLSCFLIAFLFKHVCINRFAVVFCVLFTLWNVSYLHSIITNPDCTFIIPENATIFEMFTERKYAHLDPEYSLVNVEEVENAEYLPANWTFDYQHASKCIVFEVGNDAICQYIRNGSYFDFYTDFTENYRIMLPVTWYKGYAVYEIDEQYNILEQKSVWGHPYTSQLSMNAEKGHHHYIVFYQGTRIQKYSAYISIAASLIVSLLVLFDRFYQKKNIKPGI